MKILCYVRPWNKRQIISIVENAFPRAQVNYLGDFLNLGGENLQEKFYIKYEQLAKEIDFSKFNISHETVNEIILRCRLLRSLDRSTSYRMIAAMLLSVREVFESTKPDLFISLTVDSYVMHIMSHVSKERNITYFGFVPNFINGYFRLTEKGEYRRLSSPSFSDINKVYKNIVRKKQRSIFLVDVNSQTDVAKVILKSTLKNALRSLYFSIVMLFTNDKLNYHYLVSRKFLKINFNFNSMRTASTSVLKKTAIRKMYVPLQYFPEATVDYWTEDLKLIDYENLVLEMLVRLSKLQDSIIYVKEHPSMLGIRSESFYSEINLLPNVYMLPVTCTIYDIIDYVDSAIVWTGSAGFEAALYGKQVFHFGSPYYVPNDHKLFTYCQDIDALLEDISNYSPNRNIISKDSQLYLIEYILSSCLKGNFKQPKRGRYGEWIFDQNDIESLSRSLSVYYKSIS